MLGMDTCTRAKTGHIYLTLGEAAMLADTDPSRIRKDIEKAVVKPVRTRLEVGRPETLFFEWADLIGLRTMYRPADPVFRYVEFRRAFFSMWRSHVAEVNDAWSCYERLSATATCWDDVKAKIYYSLAANVAHGEWKVWASNLPTVKPRILVAVGENVTVNVTSAIEDIDPTARLYERGLSRIERRDEVLGGEPVFKNSRLSVNHVGAMYEAGESLESILEDYRHLNLNADDVEFAKLYLRAHPPKGRPPKRGGERYSAPAT